jgi:hypothetical protein
MNLQARTKAALPNASELRVLPDGRHIRGFAE